MFYDFLIGENIMKLSYFEKNIGDILNAKVLNFNFFFNTLCVKGGKI